MLTLAFIALGSNLGNPMENMIGAIKEIEKLSTSPPLKSSLWESDPVDCPPGSPKFVNAVIAIDITKFRSPEELLARLQEIEKQFGRQPKAVLNEPRPLDLDIISFGGERRSTPALTLPHPRAHQRRFVLQPLAEIAPDFILPGQRQTVGQLLAKLPPETTFRLVRRRTT